jgi:hypothetical protein
MFSKSRRCVIASLLTILAAACGSSSDDKSADPPVAVAGFFQTKAENVPIREIELDDVNYRLRSSTCADARCDEHGTFTHDRANHRLDLRVDETGKTYSLPFEVRATAMPSALTTATLPEEEPPTLAEPGKELVETPKEALVATSVLLDGNEYNRVSESSAGRCKPACTTAAKKCVQGCIQRKSTCACWGMCADEFYSCNNSNYDCTFPSGGAC